ncbi:MAG: hypothetical protein IKU62_08760 [Ruminiclostridium sp.]|nr:hypothetical protein [Ruminiclostridium sp.]
MSISEYGLCIVSDQYFVDFPSVRHMSNKHEKRPYYLAIRKPNGIIWLVPLSSQVEKYRAKIEADEEKHGECIYYYITKLKGRESAFLIGNIIPVREEYIKKAFTVQGSPFVIQDKKDIKAINKKVNRYLTMVRYGKMQPAVDIMAIEEELKKRV